MFKINEGSIYVMMMIMMMRNVKFHLEWKHAQSFLSTVRAYHQLTILDKGSNHAIIVDLLEK